MATQFKHSLLCSILPLLAVHCFANDCRELFNDSSQSFDTIFNSPVEVDPPHQPVIRSVALPNTSEDGDQAYVVDVDEDNLKIPLGLNLLDTYYPKNSRLLARLDLATQWLHSLSFEDTFIKKRHVEKNDDIYLLFAELNFAFQNIVLSRPERWHVLNFQLSTDLPSHLLGRTVEGLYLDKYNSQIIWFKGIVFRTFSITSQLKLPTFYIEAQIQNSSITINLSQTAVAESLFVLEN